MKLSEVKKGMAVMVTSLARVRKERLSTLRDMGAYEQGFLFIDGNEDGKVSFHKDSITLHLDVEEAALVDVEPAPGCYCYID